MMETTNFGMGVFFDRMPFGAGRQDIRDKWFKMTDEEKKAYVEERMNMINQHFSERNDPRDVVKTTVEEMDKRSEEWQKMSAEEKQAFVEQRNRQAEEHFSCGRNFGRMGFRFRF